MLAVSITAATPPAFAGSGISDDVNVILAETRRMTVGMIARTFARMIVETVAMTETNVAIHGKTAGRRKGRPQQARL